MSFLLASASREIVGKRYCDGLCLYCNKMFEDPRGLGGHLRTHRGKALPSKSLSPIRSRNSLNMNRAAVDTLIRGSASQQSVASFSNERRISNFPKGSSYESVNAGNSSQRVAGNTGNQLFLSANVSPESERPEIHHFQSWCVQVSPSSETVFHFCADSSLSLGYGGQISENALPSVQYQDQGAYIKPHSDPNQLTLMRRSAKDPFMPRRRLDRGGSVGYNNNNRILNRGGRRPYSAEDHPRSAMMKRQTLKCRLMIEAVRHQKNNLKRLQFLKDVEDHIRNLKRSFDANEEPETDLDLSLHL